MCALGAIGLGALPGCSSSSGASSKSTAKEASSPGTADGALVIDSAAWNYDADHDVYYQIGLAYCTAPAADAYESMAIYVPGAYFDATENGDGTYACTVDGEGSVGAFTATTAPYVMPVDTGGYAAQAAPTQYGYQKAASYLEAGFIYLYAGCRGRDNGTNDDGSTFAGGAPWGAVDLKAAVRCMRANACLLPGDHAQVFVYGASGGGAQSAVVAASGDSALYEPYLESIGAAMEDAEGNAISDAVAGAMCWVPITNLDSADQAYEWNMGQFSSSGTRADGTFTKELSDDLAAAFADYINQAGFVDGDGVTLALEEGGEGSYTAGSYYDYLQSVIEESLNDFLSDTAFPYTPTSQSTPMGGTIEIEGSGQGADGGVPSGDASGAPTGDAQGAPSGDASSGSGPSGASSSGDAPTGTGPSGDASDAPADGGSTGGAPSGDTSALPSKGDGDNGGMASSSSSTTYDTVDDYIAALNGDEEWVAYDSATNTATVASVGAFVRACKSPSKAVGAFDDLARSEAENNLFGIGDQDSAHFDATMAALLRTNASAYAGYSDWDSSYPDAYAADLALVDDLGVDSPTRQNMYNPLYFVLKSSDGAGTSAVAPHWRIRTGIEQGDTALTTEVNLALALRACADVEDVDFATVWGQGHTDAERTGDAESNFIAWVEEACA